MTDKEQLYYFDFDKLFENYADKYYNEHADEYCCPDEFAKDLDKIYHVWATSAQDVLGGISPSEFFNKIPTEELVDILKGACVGDNNPSSLLFDRIATEPSLIGELTDLARSSSDEKLLNVVLSLIEELGGADSEFYIETIERDVDAAVKEQCIDMLCSRAEEVQDTLLERAEKCDDVGMIELYVEPLTYCEAGNDRILGLLRLLLNSDPNVAYIAALMGRYGDERATADLYPLLDTCDYAEFLEIRNAIEELGGSVDEHYRDFSQDELYQAIKHPVKTNNKKD